MLAPALWVAIATWRKLPVSTTHSVVGGLVGAGLFAFGFDGVDWFNLSRKIALPLLVSPFIAIILTVALTARLERFAQLLDGIRLCIEPAPKLLASSNRHFSVRSTPDCIVCSVDSTQAKLSNGFTFSVNHMHWITSGLLSFSRALNDTPKLIAIMLPVLMLTPNETPAWAYVWAAAAMGMGSYLAGRRITKVLGLGVTQMSHAQGFAANLISTFLVLGSKPNGVAGVDNSCFFLINYGVGLGQWKRYKCEYYCAHNYRMDCYTPGFGNIVHIALSDFFGLFCGCVAVADFNKPVSTENRN